MSTAKAAADGPEENEQAAPAAPAPGASPPATPDAKPPIQWKFALLGIPVMGLAFGGATLIGEQKNVLGAGLIALLTVVVALASPREKLWRAALIIGLSTFAMLLLATATIGVPVLAGMSMFGVAYAGTMIGAAGQRLSVAGTLISMAYLIPAATGTARDLSIPKAAELGLVGLLAAAISIGLIMLIRIASGKEPETGAPEDQPSVAAPQAPIRDQVRSALSFGDPTFRYAIRRASALAIAMGIFAATNNHNVFWVMLTMFIVLQPDEATSWHKALSRSVGVLIGAILVAGLGQFLPAEVIIGLGIVVLFVGLAWYQRSYTVFSAGISFTVVAIFGASDGSFANWAGLRVLDTLIGATIALVVGYLVLPDRNSGDPKAAGRVSSPDSPDPGPDSDSRSPDRSPGPGSPAQTPGSS